MACGGSDVYAQHVVTLLARLGVHGHSKEEVLNGKLFYRVQIADRKNVGAFLRVVGPIFGKEDACAKLVPEYGGRWSNRAHEEALPGEDGEGRAWVRLRSVEYWGEGEVWDAEFPDKGWFFANGIAVHNCGKTETVADACLGLGIILPALANEFPDDPRLMPFQKGFWSGIYAPVKEQSEIAFGRIREKLASEKCQNILADREVDIEIVTDRADSVSFSNGSYIYARTASPDTKTEGKTYHLLCCEESQGLLRSKVEKELEPMLTATNYPLVRITNRATGHVSYARTHDHSSMGVAPGAWGYTFFDVPATEDLGDGELVVVANGIASSPIPVRVEKIGGR